MVFVYFYSALHPRSMRPVLIILFVQHDSCPLCRHALIDNQSRQDNENSPEVGDNAIANIQEPRAQLADNSGIIPINLAFGFHDPDQRDGNGDRGVEYSGMYS